MSKHPLPADIIMHSKSRKLEIRFDDGNTFEYPAELLRVYSPSAEVRGHWGQGAKLEVDKQDVNITGLKTVGAYAIKITFDDGHDTGLYDWGYLYDLGKKQAIYWSKYLEKLHQAGHVRNS